MRTPLVEAAQAGGRAALLSAWWVSPLFCSETAVRLNSPHATRSERNSMAAGVEHAEATWEPGSLLVSVPPCSPAGPSVTALSQ